LKTSLLTAFLLPLFLGGLVRAEELTQDQQREIIQNFMYVTGQSERPGAALAESHFDQHLPIKCGTPYILTFLQNYDRLDRRLLASMGAQADVPPPTTQYTYGSPRGHVLLHYDKSGTEACWQPNVDSDGDGVPNYIERLADIADSCYVFEFDTLGMPTPEPDSVCWTGGDNRIDIFLQSLPGGYYGLTYGMSSCETDGNYWTLPAWIMIDNDFQELEDYIGNPVSAAQVTIAHEMFHTSHFAMDWTEHSAWLEMSAVWMEEQKYDEVNDYHLYDYVFFDNPATSLCDTLSNHHYQSVVFPIYLTEIYGRDIVKSIWLEAAAQGNNYLNPDFMRAADSVIRRESLVQPQMRCSRYSDDLTECLEEAAVPQNLATALNEFAVWNFFTGPYAEQAPNGKTYSEASLYDDIPISKMAVERVYPVQVLAGDNPFAPQPSGAMYLRLDNLGALESDTSGVFPDTLLSGLAYTPDTLNLNWALAGIFQLRDRPDSFVVMMNEITYWRYLDSLGTPRRRRFEQILGQWVHTSLTDSVQVLNCKRFSTATFVLTPAWNINGFYESRVPLEVAYQVNNYSTIDEARLNLAGAVLTPYPNPAVVSAMQGENLKFRFQLPTDDTSFPEYATAFLLVDVFNVAGERVSTIEANTEAEGRGPNQLTGIYEIDWNMKNDQGKDVASGVYLAVARLFESSSKALQLAEDRVKVAVIR